MDYFKGIESSAAGKEERGCGCAGCEIGRGEEKCKVNEWREEGEKVLPCFIAGQMVQMLLKLSDLNGPSNVRLGKS